LVKEGEAVQERTGKVAGDRIEQVKAAAGDSWSKFEHAYGAQMARVLHAWGVPTKKDLDALSHRVAELAATTKRLSKQTERPR
jgi:polyhydroxyalkanoate synthesis regulator phasin